MLPDRVIIHRPKPVWQAEGYCVNSIGSNCDVIGNLTVAFKPSPSLREGEFLAASRWTVMNSGVLQLIAVLVSMCALVWGVWTYKRNGDAQLQLLALEKPQHYLDLALAHPDLASRDESQSVDVRYAWFTALSLTTAQTLWLLVGRQRSWQRSINAIVRQHHSYLRSGAFVCGDFSPEFVGYLRTRVAELKCAESNGAERDLS